MQVFSRKYKGAVLLAHNGRTHRVFSTVSFHKDQIGIVPRELISEGGEYGAEVLPLRQAGRVQRYQDILPLPKQVS